MQCRDVEEVLEQEGLAPLPEAVRGHVAGCRECQGYIADLETIVSAAQELPAEIEPPSRVWVALRTQLELEGVIKEPAVAPKAEPVFWWNGFGQFFRGRALAALTVGAVLAAAAVVQLRQAPLSSVPNDSVPPGIQAIARQVNQQEADLRNMHLAGTSDSPVDTTLEQNLQEIDSFIADCERHLKEAPRDELARDYLADAYQQKAELLAAMMDRGRSVN